jgi:hypothetical protein
MPIYIELRQLLHLISRLHSRFASRYADEAASLCFEHYRYATASSISITPFASFHAAHAVASATLIAA